jgi:hypothetical protein
VLTVVQGDGYPDLQFPKNQLLIQTTDTTSRDQFLSLLDEIGGTLIGQIPSINTYQVRVSSKNKEELDQLKETFKGHSEIMRVAYNLIFTHAASFDVAGTKTTSKDELDQLSEAFKRRSEMLQLDNNCISAHAGSLDFSTCPVMPDNKQMYPDHDDPFDTLCDYYTALEIVAGLRDSIPMSPVTIGLNAAGYNEANGQFDDIIIEIVGPDRDEPLVPSDLFGNAIAGIVCADNDGSLVNGIASSFLGDKLRVVIAPHRDDDGFSYISAMIVLSTNADIVLNTFFTSNDPDTTVGDADMDTVRLFISEAIEASPDVFFINLAPPGIPTDENTLPSGIRRDNTLTVGATLPEWPPKSHPDYYGLIDTSAPGEGFYVVAPDYNSCNKIARAYNSSYFATAQVASAVALLKSVGGNHLTQRELKRYLLEYIGGEGYTGPVEVDGEGGVMLNYARSLTDLLWDMYQDTSWGPYIMDWNENEVHDDPYAIAKALCKEFNLEVEDIGTFTINDPPIDCYDTSFILAEDGSSMLITLNGYDDDRKLGGGFSIATPTPVPSLFAVDTPYSIGGDFGQFLIRFSAHTDWETDCNPDFEKTGDFFFTGYPITGAIEFTNCRVAERTNSGEPKSLFVDMSISCMLNLLKQEYPLEVAEVTSFAQGWFRSLYVMPLQPLGTFDAYIDEMCSEGSGEPG